MNPAAPLLASSHDPWVVGLSLLIAVLAGHVSLSLAGRAGHHEGASAIAWGLGGSVALGSGIWAMHFVGLVAWRLPIVIGYDVWPTLLSWLAAVAVSAVALGIATRERLTAKSLAGGAVVMGAGICAMHYVGMAAIDVAPGINWNMARVAASAAIAVVASGAALTIFFLLRRVDERHAVLYQAMASLAIGVAISGMHYTGMAAASLEVGAICRSAGSLSGSGMLSLAASTGIGLLLLAVSISVFDARAERERLRLSGTLVEINQQLDAANAELQRRAITEPLTGLPNRLLFEDRLRQAISRGDREAPPAGGRNTTADGLAVLFVDLDGFKPINDLLGHAAGDRLLIATAARLQSAAREGDTVACIGGDEFLMLLERAGSLADTVAVADRLLRALAEPLDIAGQPVEITASIGIVLYPDQGHPEKLIANADSAMHAAKRGGGNNYAVFESAMDAEAVTRLTLQNDLRHAADRGEMQLHYQPKVDCIRGKIIGVEALLRWTHPVHGPIRPDVFIPIAERYGVMSRLGQWVIDEACRQIGAWADEGLRMRVAINLSALQLREADLVERIGAALRRHRVEPRQLLCEITESVAMGDIRTTQDIFEGLGRIGVYLSIDDFGTGYSSLSYLRRLPARQLKIDRSFIDDLESSSDARAIVDAVIRLSHALGLSVVAEGVETAAQHMILAELGCDELQGYFFARPMPADRLLEWARGNRPAGGAEFSPSVLHEAA